MLQSSSEQYNNVKEHMWVYVAGGGEAEFCQLISTSAMASSSLQQLSFYLCLEAYLVLLAKYAVLLCMY